MSVIRRMDCSRRMGVGTESFGDGRGVVGSSNVFPVRVTNRCKQFTDNMYGSVVIASALLCCIVLRLMFTLPIVAIIVSTLEDRKRTPKHAHAKRPTTVSSKRSPSPSSNVLQEPK